MNETGAWGTGSGLSRLAGRRGFRGLVVGVLTAVLSAALLSAVAAPAAAAASTATVGDYVFAYDSGNVAAGATITDYVGSGTVLNLPSSVTIGPDTYSVTTIGEGAFFADSLTSVTIPNSVTTIGVSAFWLNSLTSVSIPNSVTTIGAWAFAYNKLTSVTIPNSVTTIGDWAFDQNWLTSVTIPNSVTTIGNGVFVDNWLTSVTIPDSVTSISYAAFARNLLTSVTIPSSVTTIGALAFSDNPLESVVMQGPVPTTMGFEPFGLAGATTPLVMFYSIFASSGYTTPRWTAAGQAYASQGLAAPSVASVSPSSGTTDGGTSVTLTGTHFTGATGVTFGGVAATSVVVGSEKKITVRTPAHAVGPVDVVVTTPWGLSTVQTFTYVAPVSAPAPDPASVATVYRFWSPTNKSHFYTNSVAERDLILRTYPSSMWTYEGGTYNAFTSQQPGTVPLYRFWSAKFKGHFFTTSEAEKDQVIAIYDDATWLFEGVAFYVYPVEPAYTGTVTVARFWSQDNKHHFYTASAAERDHVVVTYPVHQWAFEQDAFRVPSTPVVEAPLP